MSRVAKNPSKSDGLGNLRRRYIQRAETLAGKGPGRGERGDAAFLADVNECRAIWHDTRWWGKPQPYPYAKGEHVPGVLPETSAFPNMVMPAALAAAIDRDGYGARFQTFLAAWEELVNRVTFRHFPARYFPVYGPRISHRRFPHHPAWRFVAACLLYVPWSIDRERIEDLIEPASLEPLILNYDPTDIGANPSLRAWQARAQAYEDALATLLADDPDRLAAIRKIAGSAFGEVLFNVWQERKLDDHHVYIPVFPGMSGKDVRALTATAVAAGRATYGDPPEARWVAELLAEGKHKTEIARLLGIAPKTVKRMAEG